MTPKYKISIIFFMLCLAVGSLQAKREYEKTIEESFSLSDNGTLQIENRHGDVLVNAWDRNQVEIKVTITVNTNSESNAQEVFNRIDIDFTESSDFVSAKTVIDATKSTWSVFKDWLGGNSNNNDLKIDYQISMPAAAFLKLENRYGNVNIDALEGDAQLTIKYGNLEAENIGGDVVFDGGYGNAGIGDVGGDLESDIAYFKLRVGSAKDVTVNSKYSTLTIESALDINSTSSYDTYLIGTANSIDNEGKYDKIEVGEVGEIDVESKYTHIKVGLLKGELEADLAYGGVNVENVSNSFDLIDVEGRYTSIKLNLDDVSAYRMEADGRYAGISVPDNFTMQRDIKDNNEREVTGYRGNANARGMVRISASYGSIKLR